LFVCFSFVQNKFPPKIPQTERERVKKRMRERESVCVSECIYTKISNYASLFVCPHTKIQTGSGINILSKPHEKVSKWFVNFNTRCGFICNTQLHVNGNVQKSSQNRRNIKNTTKMQLYVQSLRQKSNIKYSCGQLRKKR